jgi:predicted GNAT superfamily acetyltransferase
MTSEVQIVDQAREAAAHAAARSQVDIRLLTDLDEVAAVDGLFQEVWAADKGEPLVSLALLRALAHGGGYVSGAFREGSLVGASVGFLGKTDGHLHLHSHISGVTPKLQGASVGFALKQHQRWWALNEGLEEVTWTFDPLVRMNAYFNLTKLGADIVGYKPNFYGAMPDGINRGDESDRCLVSWKLASDRAAFAAAGSPEQVSAERDGAVILEENPEGRPHSREGRADVLMAWIPSDIVAVRRTDPSRATEWRRALRQTLGAAIEDGYQATAMTKSGWYVLRRST